MKSLSLTIFAKETNKENNKHGYLFKNIGQSGFIFSKTILGAYMIRCVLRRAVHTVYAFRIKHHLPVRTSDSKINLPRPKMTFPDYVIIIQLESNEVLPQLIL